MTTARLYDNLEDATAELTAELPSPEPAPEDFGARANSVVNAVNAAARPKPHAPHNPAARTSVLGIEPPQQKLSQQPTLCDRYVLEEPIGVGGTSVVFRARDLHREADGAGDSRIAIKLLRKELRDRAFAVERLKREFRLARALTHPHVVRVFDLNCDDGQWFMTLELLEGKTLAAALTASPFAKGEPAFTARRAGDLLRACGEALAFGHDHGVVHGDFKPGNVFIPLNGQIRVLDFGAATSTEPTLERHAPAATACYASPEVLNGARPDRRDDVFSFACVAYELLTGIHPFERRSALEAQKAGARLARNWSLTDRQWYALEEALSFSREARPDNVRRLLGELFPAAASDRVEVPDRIDIADYGREFGHAPAHDAGGNVGQSFEAGLDARAAGRLPAVTMPAIYLPRDAFAPKVRAPFIAIAMIITLLLAAAAVYFQFNRNPRWPDELGASSAQLVRQLKAGINEITAGGAHPAGSQSRVPPALPPVEAPAAAPAAPSAAPPAGPRAAPETNELTPDEKTVPKPAHARATASVNDTAVGTFVSFAQDSVTVDEGANSAVLTLTRHENLTGRTEVRWRAVSGTATEGEDFIVNASGVSIFADGQVTRSIYVPLLRDAIAEPQEEFFVELYDPAPGAQIWPTARARVIIRDDD